MLAMELLLTGLPMTAERLHAHGFVNRVVPEAGLMPAALELAGAIRAASPAAVAATRAVARRTAHLPERDAYAAMRDGTVPERGRLRASPDRLEGPRAFAGKRAPCWAKGM